jgi:signal transduction histidine kinase
MLFARHDEAGERLVQSQKLEALGSLAGGVAHDFNNLISVIYNAAQFVSSSIESGDVPSQAVTAAIDDVLSASRRAKELTSQLLLVARRTPATKKRFDLGLVVGEALRLVRHALPKTIDVRASIEDGIEIDADSSRVHQVIMNLCLNARDAMPEGGRLSIRLREAPDAPRTALLEIEDNGLGMDEATKRRIFEPFFTTKGTGRGTGLGLSTALAIVEQLGGEIVVKSELGRGSTFMVRVPLASPPPSASPA